MKPQHGLALLIFSTFSYQLPVPGGFDTSLKLIGAALSIAFFLRSVFYGYKITWYSKNFIFIWFIFIFHEFISILRTNVISIADTHYIGADTYTGFLMRIGIFIVFYILTINICNKKDVIKLLYYSILFGFALNVIYAFLISAGIATPYGAGDISYKYVNVGRMTGLQGGASVFSLYVGLGIVLLAPSLINNGFQPTQQFMRFIYKNYIIHIIFICGVLFLFSSGRTGTVSLVLTLLFVFIKYKVEFIKLMPIFIILILILIQFVNIPYEAIQHSLRLPILNKLFTGVSFNQITGWDSGRLERIVSVFPVIYDNLFLGIGYGNYDLAVGDFLGERLTSHNTYLERIVEGGIVGLLIYIIFSFRIILGFNSLSNSFKKIDKMNLSIISQGFFFAAIYFSFDRFFQSDVQDKILILLFSILVALKKIEENEKKSNELYIVNNY